MAGVVDRGRKARRPVTVFRPQDRELVFVHRVVALPVAGEDGTEFLGQVSGIEAGVRRAAHGGDGAPVAHPETIATAIRIGNPASWRTAIEARDESGGMIAAVTDDEILEAYRRLAAEAGVFCEPASAASLAGLLKQARAGADLAGKTAVCILTGSGMKDPDTALTIPAVRHQAGADIASVERALGWD